MQGYVFVFHVRMNQDKIDCIIHLTMLEEYAIVRKKEYIISRPYKIYPFFQHECCRNCESCYFSSNSNLECFNLFHNFLESKIKSSSQAQKLHKHYQLIIDNWSRLYDTKIKDDFLLMQQLLKIIKLNPQNYVFNQKSFCNYVFICLIISIWLKNHGIFIHSHNDIITKWIFSMRAFIIHYSVANGWDIDEWSGFFHYIASSYVLL